jgi:hypothetical protein
MAFGFARGMLRKRKPLLPTRAISRKFHRSGFPSRRCRGDAITLARGYVVSTRLRLYAYVMPIPSRGLSRMRPYWRYESVTPRPVCLAGLG